MCCTACTSRSCRARSWRCSGATARAAAPPPRPSWAWSTCSGSVRSGKTPNNSGKKAFEIAHEGIGYVPENRDIFPKLTVHQNLLLGRRAAPKAAAGRSTTCTAMFPRLKERQHTEAGVLSGGEQQMLTLCRTLMGDPELIIIDEPTEGLAPKIVELVAEYLRDAQAARHLGAADRAEADHCAGSFRPLPGDGPRPASSSRARQQNCARMRLYTRREWLEV